MTISNFRVKHPRPHKLSDPGRDFTPEMLEKLLALPDHKLEGHHYLWLFNPILPAGRYEESVYFLPGAFRYLVTEESDYVIRVADSVIGFISIYATNLQKDGVLETARDCIREYLSNWTKQFTIVHRRGGNDERHISRGSRGYHDNVNNASVIAEAVDALVRFEQHMDLAEAFVQDLADNKTNPLKAAWFLEYVRYTKQQSLHTPVKSQRIVQLMHDRGRLRAAAELVHEHLVSSERSPTYWRDTFNELGL